MAAPPEKTLSNLSGKWVMNKKLSDDTDRILQMQNVGWFLRKAISLATVTLLITQYQGTEDPPQTHIDIDQTATGGIKGTTELRTLDWTFRPHEDGIFGKLRGKSRWVKLADVEDDGFLKEGWDDEGGDDDDNNDGDGGGSKGGAGLHVQAYVESLENGWTADQVWGFETKDGVRRHVRHVVVRKGKDWKQAKLVYDWIGTVNQDDHDNDDNNNNDLAYGEE